MAGSSIVLASCSHWSSLWSSLRAQLQPWLVAAPAEAGSSMPCDLVAHSSITLDGCNSNQSRMQLSPMPAPAWRRCRRSSCGSRLQLPSKPVPAISSAYRSTTHRRSNIAAQACSTHTSQFQLHPRAVAAQCLASSSMTLHVPELVARHGGHPETDQAANWATLPFRKSSRISGACGTDGRLLASP